MSTLTNLFHKIPLSRKLKHEIREFDENKCVICKTHGTSMSGKNRLMIHHSDFKSRQYPDVSNCVLLCLSCHGKITTEGHSPIARLLDQIMEERLRRLELRECVTLEKGV